MVRATHSARVTHDPNFRQFRSPSRNIFCNIHRHGGASGARCDIRHHTFQAPPKPASCHFDWGSSVRVNKTAGFLCVSDPATESPHVRTLAYGDHIKLGHTRCTSHTTGMVCRNLNSHHGFKLSRAAATFF
jgi:hypothetical protein